MSALLNLSSAAPTSPCGATSPSCKIWHSYRKTSCGYLAYHQPKNTSNFTYSKTKTPTAITSSPSSPKSPTAAPSTSSEEAPASSSHSRAKNSPQTSDTSAPTPCFTPYCPWSPSGSTRASQSSLKPRRPIAPTTNPHLSKIRWNARFGLRTAVTKLESKGNVADMGATEYRDSWAWVHFMLYGPPEGHAELVRYLRDIAAGVPPGSLGERLAARIRNPEQEYLTHFRNWAPKQ